MLRENLEKIKHLFLYSEIHSELFSNWAFSNRDITKVIENIEDTFGFVADCYGEDLSTLKSHFNDYLKNKIAMDKFIEAIITLLEEEKLLSYLKAQNEFLCLLKTKLSIQDEFLLNYGKDCTIAVTEQAAAAPKVERDDSTLLATPMSDSKQLSSTSTILESIPQKTPPIDETAQPASPRRAATKQTVHSTQSKRSPTYPAYQKTSPWLELLAAFNAACADRRKQSRAKPPTLSGSRTPR